MRGVVGEQGTGVMCNHLILRARRWFVFLASGGHCLRQGCAISPLPLVIFIDAYMKGFTDHRVASLRLSHCVVFLYGTIY